MSHFLRQLNQAQQHLPVGLPQATGADLLMTLLMWQQLSNRHRVESKLIAGHCAGQSRIMADMLSAIPIPFSPETLFDACQWQSGQAGSTDAGRAIHHSLTTLCQQHPRLDRIFRPERFGPSAPWAHLFANTPIWANIMQAIRIVASKPCIRICTFCTLPN